MKLLRHSLSVVFLTIASIMSAAFAQGTIGPATEGGVDRFYDDGFVRVDATDNFYGFTWFWGYQNPSQVVGDSIEFHSLVQQSTEWVLVTDRYARIGEFFPDAPYNGSFSGPGFVLPDIPLSRTFTVVPEPTAITLFCIALGILTCSKISASTQGAAANHRPVGQADDLDDLSRPVRYLFEHHSWSGPCRYLSFL